MELVELTDGIAKHAQKVQEHPFRNRRHRQADQPAGAQCRHRGGAGRRSGRGFAVVADEVRDLSGRTTQFSQQISTLMESMQTSVHQTEQAIQRMAGQDMTFALNSKTQVGADHAHHGRAEPGFAMWPSTAWRVVLTGSPNAGQPGGDRAAVPGHGVAAHGPRLAVESRRWKACSPSWARLAAGCGPMPPKAISARRLRICAAKPVRSPPVWRIFRSLAADNPVGQQALSRGDIELF